MVCPVLVTHEEGGLRMRCDCRSTFLDLSLMSRYEEFVDERRDEHERYAAY